MLKTATDVFSPQSIVAIVGNPSSGKTVLGTLLKDAIFTYFVPKHADKFSANLIKGNDVLEQTEQCLFKEKIFPPETTPGEKSELVIEIARTESLGSKINIRIRDISGEDYKLAFYGDDVTPETRVNNVLTLKKEKTDNYGSFSFLIFAKLYVILIDCAEFENWKVVQTRQSQMLNSILAFKQILEETQDGKFTTPLAVILTKTDTLQNGIEGSPEYMIEKYMPQFYQTLSYIHSGKRKFFSMFIESEKPESASQKIPETTEPLKPPTQEEQAVAEQTSPIKKLKRPISYSNGEYVKFILWIIEMLS